MLGAEHARVVLRLDGDDPVICGTIAVRDEPSRPFRGWLELASVLELARTRIPEGAAQPPSSRAPKLPEAL